MLIIYNSVSRTEKRKLTPHHRLVDAITANGRKYKYRLHPPLILHRPYLSRSPFIAIQTARKTAISKHTGTVIILAVPKLSEILSAALNKTTYAIIHISEKVSSFFSYSLFILSPPAPPKRLPDMPSQSAEQKGQSISASTGSWS